MCRVYTSAYVLIKSVQYIWFVTKYMQDVHIWHEKVTKCCTAPLKCVSPPLSDFEKQVTKEFETNSLILSHPHIPDPTSPHRLHNRVWDNRRRLSGDRCTQQCSIILHQPKKACLKQNNRKKALFPSHCSEVKWGIRKPSLPCDSSTMKHQTEGTVSLTVKPETLRKTTGCTKLEFLSEMRWRCSILVWFWFSTSSAVAMMYYLYRKTLENMTPGVEMVFIGGPLPLFLNPISCQCAASHQAEI